MNVTLARWRVLAQPERTPAYDVVVRIERKGWTWWAYIDYTPARTNVPFLPPRMTLSRARDGGSHITRRGAERWARRIVTSMFDVTACP